MSARAFAAHELAARAWWNLSAYRDERALAARRFRETAPACDDDDLRLQIVSVLAVEGFHARGITAPVVHDYAERLARGYSSPSMDAAREQVSALVSGVARALRMSR